MGPCWSELIRLQELSFSCWMKVVQQASVILKSGHQIVKGLTGSIPCYGVLRGRQRHALSDELVVFLLCVHASVSQSKYASDTQQKRNGPTAQGILGDRGTLKQRPRAGRFPPRLRDFRVHCKGPQKIVAANPQSHPGADPQPVYCSPANTAHLGPRTWTRSLGVTNRNRCLRLVQQVEILTLTPSKPECRTKEEDEHRKVPPTKKCQDISLVIETTPLNTNWLEERAKCKSRDGSFASMAFSRGFTEGH